MKLFAGSAFLLLILAGICNTGVIALGNQIEAHYAISHTAFGVLTLFFFFGIAAATLVVARILRRVSLGTIGLGGIAVLIAANLLLQVDAYPALCAARLLTGAGVSTAMLLCGTTVVRHFHAHQRAGLALLHGILAAASALGALAAVPACNALARVGLGWTWVTTPAAALTLVAVPVFLKHRSDAAAACSGGSHIDWASLIRRRPMAATLPLHVFYMIAEIAVFIFYPLYAHQVLGWPTASAALMASLFLFGLGFGRIGLSFLPRVLPSAGLAAALILSGSALLLFGLFLPRPSPAVIGTIFFLCGTLLGPTIPVATSWTVSRIPDHADAAFAVGNFCQCAGGFAGALAAGWMSDGFSLRTAILACVILFISAAVPLLLPERGN